MTMLIIFDCDGVLVDSELIASRELAAYLTDLGRSTQAEECRESFTGLSLHSVSVKIETEWGVTLPNDFVAQLRTRDRAAFERNLKPVPGIFHALDKLDLKGIPYCVASSGTPEKIRHSLTVTGLLKRFDNHLFSASQVVNGKPAPDLFLFAAHSMGFDPAACMVIEDSVAGVQGAKAAGMRVLGFTGASHCGPGYAATLSQADAVFDDLNDLMRFL